MGKPEKALVQEKRIKKIIDCIKKKFDECGWKEQYGIDYIISQYECDINELVKLLEKLGFVIRIEDTTKMNKKLFIRYRGVNYE